MTFIPGPFVVRAETTQAERVYDAAARLVAEYPERFSVVDGDREIHIWRHRPSSSLRPFYVWLLAAFVVGAVAGAAVVFLAQHATAALPSSPSRGASNSGLTSGFEGSAAIAERMVGVSRSAGDPSGLPATSSEPSPSDSARGSHHMAEDDVLSAASASPRGDPPAAVLGLQRSSKDLHAPAELRAVLIAIHRAAREFGQHPGRMVGVAYCESSFDPTKVGAAGERGIWQFMATTWSENAPRLGYDQMDITDPVASSRVAAEMWSRGLQDRWTCAR